MAYTIIQAGDGLAFVDPFGVLTPVPLPANISLRADVPPRWVVYSRFVILVNTPSRPLSIDSTGTVRALTPLAPRLAPTLEPGAATGNLTGTYDHGRYTFIVRDDDGTLIAESDFSPASSNPVTIVSQNLRYANLDISPDNTVTARRCYRTTTDGAVLFQWVDLDGNVLRAVEDDLPDAGLSETAAPILGTPPRLTLIAEFRDRLFGVGDLDIDSVVYTETGLMYAWPADNSLIIPRVGSDAVGVTGFLTRRESLGVGRLNRILAITGSGQETTSGEIDFRVIVLSDQCGVVSNEATVVYRDIAYFLWHDGVYQWDDNGFVCLSDGVGGRGRVRSWFASDDYFDRDQFSHAFAQIDTTNRVKYRLFLYDKAGVIHFVEFDLNERTWDGPHRVDAFTATSAFLRANMRSVQIPTVGAADGGIYDQGPTPTATDFAISGQPYGIDFDVDSKFYPGSTPDREQYWGQLSMLGAVQNTGIVTVTPKVGYLDAPAQAPIGYEMRRGRQRLRRLGFGKLAQLNLRHTAVNEPVAIFGFEIDDVHEGGRR